MSCSRIWVSTFSSWLVFCLHQPQGGPQTKDKLVWGPNALGWSTKDRRIILYSAQDQHFQFLFLKKDQHFRVVKFVFFHICQGSKHDRGPSVHYSPWHVYCYSYLVLYMRDKVRWMGLAAWPRRILDQLVRGGCGCRKFWPNRPACDVSRACETEGLSWPRHRLYA